MEGNKTLPPMCSLGSQLSAWMVLGRGGGRGSFPCSLLDPVKEGPLLLVFLVLVSSAELLCRPALVRNFWGCVFCLLSPLSQSPEAS